MASVQELIAAAEAQKSPFVRMLEGAAGGYIDAQNTALEREKNRISIEMAKQQMEQQRQDQIRQEENRKRIESEYAAEMEKQRANEVNAAGVKPSPTFPQQKMEVTFNRDAEGNLSSKRSFVPQDGTSSSVYTKEQVEAISTGDPSSLSKSFPGGVPREAITSTLTAGRLGNTEERQDTARTDRINKDVLQYSNALESNSMLKELNKQQIGLNQISDLIEIVKSGNSVAASALGTKMARGMGEVGVLTESDITRYVESGRLDRKTADKLSKWLKGRPTDATIEEINQIADVLKDSFDVKVQPIYDRYINRLSKNYGMSTTEAAERLAVPYSGGSGRSGSSGVSVGQNTNKSGSGIKIMRARPRQ